MKIGKLSLSLSSFVVAYGVILTYVIEDGAEVFHCCVYCSLSNFSLVVFCIYWVYIVVCAFSLVVFWVFLLFGIRQSRFYRW